jgi:uncharacterized protein YuzE
LKVIYDAETDTLSLILRNKPVVESDEVREGIIIDYGENGRVVFYRDAGCLGKYNQSPKNLL